VGRKSTIEKLPVHIVEELTKRIYSGRFTIEQMKGWVTRQGYNLSNSALDRYCHKVRYELKGLGLVGISLDQYYAHQKEIDEINRLAGLKTLIEIRLNKLHQIVLEDV